jgi:hypothetical protein
MKIKEYNQLYGLVSNPNTRDIKIKVYEALVYSTFLEKNSIKITISDIESYASKAGLTAPSKIFLLNVISYLENEKIIIVNNETISLSDSHFLSNFQKLKTENQEKISAFFEFMTSLLQNHFQEPFSKDFREELTNSIGHIISDVMEEYADSVVNFYSGEFSLSAREHIDTLIHKHISNLSHKDKEYLREIEKALLRDFRGQFLNPESVFANGLRFFAIKHLMSSVLEKNPSTESIKKEFFSDTVLLVDTNVLISILCPSSRTHSITSELFSETRKLGGKVLISNWTEVEFRNAIDNAKYLFDLIKKGKIGPWGIDNEIINEYYASSKKGDWFDLVSEIQKNFTELIKSKNVEIEVLPTPDESKLQKIKNLLNEEYTKREVDKKPDLIDHDARILMYIQESRADSDNTIGTYWFLTRDERLRKIEAANLTKLGFTSKATISCDLWFEILIPFIDTELNDEEVSKSFSKLIGVTLLPVPDDIVDSYVKHLSIQFDLPTEDITEIKKQIENIHLRNILEAALAERDYYGVAMLLRDTIKDKREKEEYAKTINRLSSIVRTLENDLIAKSFISEKELDKLRYNVIHSTPPNEKGKSLEDLAAYLFDNINGMDIIQRRPRLEAEEIDLILKNGAFQHWGDPIIVECKNWSSPISKTEVVDFIDKVKTCGASTGVLIAFKGVTGDYYKDAFLKIREALKEKIRILVITWEDIEKIKSNEDWIKILDDKFYLPSKLPK